MQGSWLVLLLGAGLGCASGSAATGFALPGRPLGNLTGTVRAASGVPLEGAKVVVEGPNIVGQLEARSDRRGVYFLPNVPVGWIRVYARAECPREGRFDGGTALVNVAVPGDARDDCGALPPISTIDLASSAVRFVLFQEEIRSLPARGRGVPSLEIDRSSLP